MDNLIDGAIDLRSGLTVWEARHPPLEGQTDLPKEISVDILIVGAGITGAFLAERLSRHGESIMVVDRRGPLRGSTAASTALLSWELDAPMLRLEQLRGFDAAARAYRRSRETVAAIAGLVDACRIPCHFTPRGSLYLAGSALDPADLREEQRLRSRAGIAGDFLAADGLAAEGIAAEAALAYRGCAEADPVALARGLLAAAVQRGAVVAAPVTAVAYGADRDGVTVATDLESVIHARRLVLATGYEMPEIVPATIHEVTATWSLATPPLPADRLWRTRAIVWEASDPYLYMRTTGDGRIVAGGEDEPLTDARARDALTPEKTGRIAEKVGALLPHADIGTFPTSPGPGSSAGRWTASLSSAASRGCRTPSPPTAMAATASPRAALRRSSSIA